MTVYRNQMWWQFVFYYECEQLMVVIIRKYFMKWNKNLDQFDIFTSQMWTSCHIPYLRYNLNVIGFNFHILNSNQKFCTPKIVVHVFQWKIWTKIFFQFQTCQILLRESMKLYIKTFFFFFKVYYCLKSWMCCMHCR